MFKAVHNENNFEIPFVCVLVDTLTLVPFETSL